MRYRNDIIFAQRFGGDFIVRGTDEVFSASRMTEAMRHANENNDMIDVFQRIALKGKSIGNVYRTGQISLDRALGLIEQADKFKDWIDKIPPDKDLLTKYLDSMNSKSFLEGFPGRELKFSIMGAAGIAIGASIAGIPGALAGLGLNAFETYFLGHLAKGWRPNSFIEKLKRDLPA
jgi:hypothetical protein